MNIIVNLNKETGASSQEAVTAVKRAFKVKKAGHAGTLDPLATGVLLVCLNEATKVAGMLTDFDKEYIMTAKLGESTDTYDSEGRVTETVTGFNVSKQQLIEASSRFLGEIEQVPPMYSALKHEGKPLYELARKGIEIERKARKIKIYDIQLLSFERDIISMRIACSKGTYIRSFCHDLGQLLGTGAHMTGLCRTRIGGFTIKDAALVSELPGRASALKSIDEAVGHFPEISLKDQNLKYALHGNPIPLAGLPDLPDPASGLIRIKDDRGRVFAIGKVSGGRLRIERLLNV